MSQEKNTSGLILRFTLREFVGLIIAIVTVVFSGTMIWNRFISVESNAENQELLQEQRDLDQDARIEYVNDRIDRKFNQLKEKS